MSEATKSTKLPEGSGFSKNDGLPQKGDSEVGPAFEVLRFVPESLQRTYLRAVTGEASPREAIRAFCLSCVVWDRKEVRLCGDTTCPLHRYRPFVDNEAGK